MELFSTILAIGTLVLFVVSIGTFMYSKIYPKCPYTQFISNNIPLIGFIIALSASLGSIVYSNVIGFPPCFLCWLQRICIFPQIVIFGAWVYTKNEAHRLSARILAYIGVGIALYHIVLESTGGSLPCPAGIGEVSCAVRYVYEFNFVSIPVMSLSVSLSLLLLTYITQKGK